MSRLFTSATSSIKKDQPGHELKRCVNPKKVEYTGPFIKQNDLFNCVAHTLANVFLALGEPLDFDFFAELTNQAYNRESMSFHDAGKLLYRYRNIKIQTAMTPLYQTSKEKVRNNQYRYQKLIRDNAREIAWHLDRGGAITAGIGSLRSYVGIDHPYTHAVAVTGYEIDQNSFMDVQITDSGIGHLWLPIEHLSASLYAEDGYAQYVIGALPQAA